MKANREILIKRPKGWDHIDNLSQDEITLLRRLGIVPSEEESRAIDLAITTFIYDGGEKPDRLITAFCQYIESGVYPSDLVLDEIHKRFKKYLTDNSNGKNNSDLGDYFGAKGRRVRWRESVYNPILYGGSLFIYCLSEWFDVDVKDAIKIVSNWVIDQEEQLPSGWSKTERRKSSATLHKEYYRYGKKGIERSLTLMGIKENPSKEKMLAALEPLEEYLSGYPQLQLILKGLRADVSKI